MSHCVCVCEVTTQPADIWSEADVPSLSAEFERHSERYPFTLRTRAGAPPFDWFASFSELEQTSSETCFGDGGRSTEQTQRPIRRVMQRWILPLRLQEAGLGGGAMRTGDGSPAWRNGARCCSPCSMRMCEKRELSAVSPGDNAQPHRPSCDQHTASVNPSSRPFSFVCPSSDLGLEAHA